MGNLFQLILQSAGAGPSVLQQLCTLPFPFYGDPRLIPYTLPALLAATHHNSEAMAILSCEMSYEVGDGQNSLSYTSNFHIDVNLMNIERIIIINQGVYCLEKFEISFLFLKIIFMEFIGGIYSRKFWRFYV